jgi:ribosomal protein L11 methyltransferase
MQALILLAPQALVEPLSDALVFDLDAQSVTVEDADAGQDDEQPLYGEPDAPVDTPAWQHSRVIALFAGVEQAQRASEQVLGDAAWHAVHLHAIEAVPDADWVRLTQSQFEPIAVTSHFWIVPSWHDAPPQARRVLRLDPGLAFGSGTHATTRMCLRWIATHAQHSSRDTRVLDYGCGSGILAIAAAMHGAGRVDAVDIDPAAWHATQDNAAINHVDVTVGAPDRVHKRTYDIVLANILATPLKLLAPVLGAHLDLAAGSHIVLSGILTRQVNDLCAVYAPIVTLRVHDEEDGWVMLAGTTSPR